MDVLSRTDLPRRLAWARLSVAGLLLVASPLLARSPVPTFTPRIFAAAITLAVISSAVPLLGARAHPPPASFSAIVLGLDVATVTLIVLATGGPQSIFAFLYVLVIVAACVLLSRPGALAVASASSLLYMAAIVGPSVLPPSNRGDSIADISPLALLTMCLNTGTFLVVALTAGTLAERYRSAHDALEDQRKDLSDLQAFRDLIFESVGAGLIALDPDGRITAYNRAAAEITGVPPTRAIGEGWETVFGDGADVRQVFEAVRGDARAFRRCELTIRRLSGPEVPVAVTFWALRSGSGEPVGLIAVCEDLSSIRRMEARVRQADRLAAVGRMAANIAHEIRNPLASLTGAIEVLARGTDFGETRERLAQIVLRESERLDRVIRDFLDYARPAPLAVQTINLADTLDEVLLLLEHHPRPDNVKIVRSYGRRLLASADPQQIRQVLWNLCLNALDAMPGGGELRVTAHARDGRLEVAVADSGSGIPAADLAHIFEPFFSTKTEGSGIGLALVHRIVQEHGGDVDVRTASGLGTTFTITLPAVDA